MPHAALPSLALTKDRSSSAPRLSEVAEPYACRRRGEVLDSKLTFCLPLTLQLTLEAVTNDLRSACLTELDRSPGLPRKQQRGTIYGQH